MLYHLSVIKIQRFPFSCVLFAERLPGLCGVQAAEEAGVGWGAAPRPQDLTLGGRPSCPAIIAEIAPAS